MTRVRRQPPDLQKCIERYGEYWRIPWEAWDRAMAEFDVAYREEIANEREKGQ
jgi:hypothetical protein